MNLTTKSFKLNQQVDLKFSGRGEGLSPQLSWNDLPKGTKSLALFSHDPDAPIASGFWHGQIVNIPVSVLGIEEGEWNDTPGLIKNNDGDRLGYTPPGPPEGTGPHSYNFTIYALPFEDINEVASKMGMEITAQSSRAITAFIVEMNKLDSKTISFIDKFSK